MTDDEITLGIEHYDEDQIGDSEGDAEPLIPIEKRPAAAGEWEISALGETVAACTGCDPDESVYACIFVDELTRFVPEWKLLSPADIVDAIESYTAQWKVTPRMYDYPESRLRGPQPCGVFHPLPCGLDTACAGEVESDE